MRGVVRVVAAHGPARLAHAHVVHARIVINAREVRTAHALILVEQHLRAIDGAVGVQVLRMFQRTDGFVDPVALLIVQRGVEPARRIVRVNPPRQIKLMPGPFSLPRIAEGFAQVAAQHGARRFQRRRRA